MSESVVIEVYENERHGINSGWQMDTNLPWTLKTMEKCCPPDEFVLPGGEWGWTSNWRIDKKPGQTDSEGWEYASKLGRFGDIERIPKTEKLWNDKARRRLWSRIMRREAGTSSKNTNISIVMPKIQNGLRSINAARVRIEEIMLQAPEAAQTEQMISLVKSVKKNIVDINNALDQVDKQQGVSSSHAAIIKKLRNDVTKEEIAMDKALYPGSEESKKSHFMPLSKKNSNDKKWSSNSNSRGSINSGCGGSFGHNNRNNNNNNNDRDDMSSSLSSSITNRGSVSGGCAGNFNPSAIASNTAKTASSSVYASSIAQANGNKGHGFDGTGGMGSTNWDMDKPEDGVFVERSQHEKMIEAKLKPIDEATVMQELIDERSIEITKVHKGLLEVNEMFVDLSRIVKSQELEILNIFDNVEESHAKTEEAFSHIIEANRLHKNGNCNIM